MCRISVAAFLFTSTRLVVTLNSAQKSSKYDLFAFDRGTHAAKMLLDDQCGAPRQKIVLISEKGDKISYCFNYSEGYH